MPKHVQVTFTTALRSGFFRCNGIIGLIVAVVVPIITALIPLEAVGLQPGQLRIALIATIAIASLGVTGAVSLIAALHETIQVTEEQKEALETWRRQAEKAKDAMPALPKALYGTTATDGSATVLLEPSELFAHSTGVTFYFRNSHEFEDLLGFGTVYNVQQDGKIQASMLIETGTKEVIDKIRKNERDTLEHLSVKPTLPYDLTSRFQGFSRDNERA